LKYTQDWVKKHRKWGSNGIRRFMTINEAFEKWKLNNRERYEMILHMVLEKGKW
jgi:hypothetical protein